jgi:16S rRNA (cytosine967-C5)-methyltransferase
MSEPSPARTLAARVLERVRRGKRFSADELERALAGGALGREDRALATTLVYGTLRHQGTIDWVLGRAADVRPERVHPVSLDHLRVAGYQLLYLARVPAFAAVDEAVDLVRRAGGRRAAGFANAVLRAVGRALVPGVPPTGSPRRDLPRGDGTCAVFADDFLPDPTDAAEHLAVTLSHPRWLVLRWLERLGRERTEAICRAGLAPPPLILRANRLRTTRDDLLARLPGAKPGEDPWAIRLEAAGSVAELPGYDDGQFMVQDEASMRAAPLLAPRPEGAYVDLCAAPGGKATQLAELMADRGRIVAVDPHRARLAKLARSCLRLRLGSLRWACADGRRPPLRAQVWDGVLVDAPCSNTGVLARRVEARWRLRPTELAALAPVQLGLLVSAATLVRPGGRLVYSTCSIEREENEERVAAFLQGMGGGFRTVSAETLWPAPGRCGGFLALLERAGASG